MVKFSRDEIENLIQSDFLYGDITTSLLNVHKSAKLAIVARDNITLSCLDTIKDIALIYDLEFKSDFANSQSAKKDDEIAMLKGDFSILHSIYKSVQNLLEYACGIATYANLMLHCAKEVNEKCEILVTRKVIPFSKKLSLKAALEGGANIHRIGLSDSILFFENHLVVYEKIDDFLRDIPRFKNSFCERKVIAESDNVKFAKDLLAAGIDGVQCDKMSVLDFLKVVEFRDEYFKDKVILAAGGINLKNIKSYARADAIVTSAIYKGSADLGARITIL